jgi:hypothetical protein
MITQADVAREFGATTATTCNWAAAGCDLRSIGHVIDWLQANGKGKWVQSREARLARIAGGGPADDPELSTEAMLGRIKKAELAAFGEVEGAEPGLPRQQALKAHGQAVATRIQHERDIMELIRESGELVTPQASRDIIMSALVPIAKLIEAIEGLAEEANPDAPEVARAVLSAWSEEAKAAVRSALEPTA